MKKTMIFFVAAALALVLAAPSMASNDIARQEGDMVCTACHDKPGSKLLTDQGKYYELMGDLEGFSVLEQSFQRCTYCHARKPGSEKLTKVGRRYQWMMGDMEGIKGWLLEEHPEVPEMPEEEGPDSAPDPR